MTKKTRKCIGGYPGPCGKVAQHPKTGRAYWCDECERLRRKHISRRFAEIAQAKEDAGGEGVTFNADDPGMWERLHLKCLALRVLGFGAEAPKGVPQEIWNVTIANAWLTLNEPVPGLEDEKSNSQPKEE